MKPPFFTWLPMPNLPIVPDEFVERAKAMAAAADPDDQDDLIKDIKLRSTEYKDRKIYKNGVEMGSRYHQGFDLGDDWKSWVRQNIKRNIHSTTLRLSRGNTTEMGPHIDQNGCVKLFYLLDRGGDDCETLYYLHPDWPPMINSIDNVGRDPIHYDYVDELIIIDRAQFPLNQWILHNGWVMHGVTGATGPRLNLDVSFTWDESALHLLDLAL